jgi:hypothetical protein
MSVINNLLSYFYSARTEDFIVQWLSPEQVPDGLARTPIPPDEQYLRVDLRALRVVYVRKGLTKLYGMVNSHINLPHLGTGEAEFQAVVSPPDLKDVDAAHLDRYLAFNAPLAGPVPYRGGDVKIQVGLFSVASANLLDPYVQLLEAISKQCSVEFINLALPYAGLLSKGVALLTGSGNPQTLEIGVSTSFDSINSGWLLVLRADRTTFPESRVAKFKVVGADAKLDEGGTLIKDYPYMLLRFSGTPRRDDYFKIPELKAQHDLFTAALRKGDANEIQPALSSFQRYLFTCPDLLTADADKVYARAKADADRLYPPTATSPFAERARREPLPLEAYDIYP